MFTSSSRAVHEQLRSSSRLMRNSGARVGAWVYTGLPGHCSPFQRSPARRQFISQRQHAATRKQTTWTTCHDKIVAKVVQVSVLHYAKFQNSFQNSCPDMARSHDWFTHTSRQFTTSLRTGTTRVVPMRATESGKCQPCFTHTSRQFTTTLRTGTTRVVPMRATESYKCQPCFTHLSALLGPKECNDVIKHRHHRS